MIDKLIEGKLLTLIVGSVFRLVEIAVRTVHITVRGIRLLVQESVTSRLDRRLSVIGKRRVARRARVDASSIVIIERDGEYTGDPKYIAEELLRRETPVTITWVLRPSSVGPFPRGFHFVRSGTADFFRAVARAKVVVHDGRALQDSGAVKAASQHWLDTSDVAAELGHPRTDLLFDRSPETAKALREKVLDRLGVADTGQHFALYAPERRRGAGAVTLSGVDFRVLRAALGDRFGGTWELLVRTPASDKAAADMLMAGLPSYCRDASLYPDLQELLVVADVGITDRSEWLDDFVLTGKPAFRFAPASGETAVGGTSGTAADHVPVATSNAQLRDRIAGFEGFDGRSSDAVTAGERRADGAAAARVADRIEELLAR